MHPVKVFRHRSGFVRLQGADEVPAQLKIGQRVLVERGPLAGLEGVLLQMRSQCRIVVSVTMLQRSVAAEIGRDCISPILR